MEGELNRRLKQGDVIIYPITRHENVVGLQKTIVEKLPIISPTTPQEGIARQVWLDTSTQEEESDEIVFEGVTEDEPFYIDDEANDNSVYFEQSSDNNLTFDDANQENTELTFEEGLNGTNFS